MIPDWSRRLADDDGAQVLVEYSLMAALVGIASYGVLVQVAASLHRAYVAWGRALDTIWDMPPPGSAS